MPNGGSDCCGTCCFYSKNDENGKEIFSSKDAEAAELQKTIRSTRNPIESIFLWIRFLIQYRDTYLPGVCTIRQTRIWKAQYYTYCANHPYWNPEKSDVPIGPVFTGYDRRVWKKSADNQKVRQKLLELVSQAKEATSAENPIIDTVIWQLREFKEKQAVNDLKRIENFSPEVDTGIINFARQALDKIEGRIPRSDKRFP